MRIYSLDILAFITAMVFLMSLFVYGLLKHNQEERKEIKEPCRAANYELVTIKGRHYCLPFMPKQEIE